MGWKMKIFYVVALIVFLVSFVLMMAFANQLNIKNQNGSSRLPSENLCSRK